MPILPNREELRVEYDAAIQELLSKELTNQNLDKGWYRQIGGSLFDACYRALEDACHPEARRGLQGTPYVSRSTLGCMSSAHLSEVARPRSALLSLWQW
jgi:hypothetical protein